MTDIARSVDAIMFGSNSAERARIALLRELDSNRDGLYDPNNGDEKRRIKIFGYSWGALSAVALARAIDTDRRFRARDIELLAVIDPVNTVRGEFPSVPANVRRFWNRYQSGNRDVNILGLVRLRGFELAIDAGVDQTRVSQRDLNQFGKTVFLDRSSLTALKVGHWSIVAVVRGELSDLLNRSGIPSGAIGHQPPPELP